MSTAAETQVAPALATRSLSAGYNGVPVVHDVNLEVRSGEIVALLGPNGAGKSTTLLTICGSLAPISGEILIEGQPSRDPMYRRCRESLAFVTEERAVFPSLTVAENLRLGTGPSEAALDLMPELRSLLRRKAGLLSGGEQQMLAIGRCVAAKPKVLVVDELSLGLAPLIVERLLKAVRDAADLGMGVLMVEQYARRAVGIADRVYVMARGKIVLSGPTGDDEALLRKIEGTYLSQPNP
jgi:branched-chain amino acid transport system ATP-binding protein